MAGGEYGCTVRHALAGPVPWEYEERYYRLEALEHSEQSQVAAGRSTAEARLFPFTKRTTDGHVIREGICLIPNRPEVATYVLRLFSITGMEGEDGVGLQTGAADSSGEVTPATSIIPHCPDGKSFDTWLDECVCDNGSFYSDCWEWPDPPGPSIPPGDCEPAYESCGGGSGGGGDGDDHTIPTCDPEVQLMIAEYATRGMSLAPTCDDFANSGGATYFTWSELNGHFQDGNTHNPWGMVTSTLKNRLDTVRGNYGYPIRLSSGYRCPDGNSAVRGANNSYHMHGRAADMYSVGPREWTEEEFELLAAAADLKHPTERFDWYRYTDHHLHVAW